RQPRPGSARWIRMMNPEQLSAHAEECEAKAETAHDPKVRMRYRDLAAQWRKLARQHEEIESARLILTAARASAGAARCPPTSPSTGATASYERPVNAGAQRRRVRRTTGRRPDRNRDRVRRVGPAW